MIETAHLSPKHREFLLLIKQRREVASLKQLCEESGLDFNFAKGVVGSGMFNDLIEFSEIPYNYFGPGKKKDGAKIPGLSLLEILASENSMPMAAAQERLGGEVCGKEINALKRENVIALEKLPGGGREIKLTNTGALNIYRERQQKYQLGLDNKLEVSSSEAAWLVKNELLELRSDKDYTLSAKAVLRDLNIREQITQLTPELIMSGGWEDKDFKPYKVDDAVPSAQHGKPSILGYYLEQVRDIFFSMGFDEMHGRLVESSFWNFDALFTPQDHPAREVHDTFFVDNPDKVDLPQDAYLLRAIKEVHEKCYDSEWDPETARKAVLRTHTTASSARKLYGLQGKGGKFFSVDKVFRNESPDKTHLAEFHQIEGFVIGDSLGIPDLASHLSHFYSRLGFRDIRFKSTSNPYTEPSLEVLATNPRTGKIVEVGNSGIFRPEVLNPLGYEGKSVIAWGLGLERIAMLCANQEQLSDIVGPESKLNIRHNLGAYHA